MLRCDGSLMTCGEIFNDDFITIQWQFKRILEIGEQLAK